MQNLKATREARGISKNKLSQMVGCGFGQLTDWERCESSPNLANAAKLARALGTTIDELVGDLDEAPAV